MNNKTLVCAKVNPDLDGTACTLAYSYLLNKKGATSEGFVFGTPQSEVGYFIKVHKIEIPTYKKGMNSSWDDFILVDASSMKGMPDVVEPEKVIEIIDHRTSEPEKEFPNAKIQNELIGAAATIVVERFIKENIKPTLDYAKLLYGAIFHNTLNLISSNTTERDRNAISYLASNFNLKDRIIKDMFDYTTGRIKENIIGALEMDNKEFEILNRSIGSYQLIIWGKDFMSLKELIEKSIESLREKMGSSWALLNIVDLETKRSHIYVTDTKGEKMLSKVLGVNFKNGWTVLDKPILRKQIMPLILK